MPASSAARGPPRPGSASPGGEHGGSRQLAQRFEYSGNSKAGFVERAPTHVMTGQDMFTALQTVPEVEHVEWQLPKSARCKCGDPIHGAEQLGLCLGLCQHSDRVLAHAEPSHETGSQVPLFHRGSVLQGTSHALAHGCVAYPSARHAWERAQVGARTGLLQAHTGKGRAISTMSESGLRRSHE